MEQTLHGTHCMALLQSVYPSLSPAEQKVADAVLKDAEQTVYSSVTDLAENSGVGETTVIRFCRKLGFRGFQEFKLSLAQELVGPSRQVYGQVQEEDDLATMVQKITLQNKQALLDTQSLLQESMLERATNALLAGRNLYFFGVGSSGMTAMDAEYRFMRLGFQAHFACDAHVIAMHCSLLTRADVVVGISSSGSTKDLVDAVRIAKEKGAYIICLTSHARSPITQYANAVLLSAARESPLQGGAFASKVAQIHVLDVLATVVSMRKREETFAAMESTAKAVLDKLY